MRRGRRDPEPCEVGDAVDLWRVVAFDADRRLTLVAELKMPGRAWLQFDGLPATGREPARLRQTALFDPRSLFRLWYCVSLLPAHTFIFRGVLRAIGKRAEAEEHAGARHGSRGGVGRLCYTVARSRRMGMAGCRVEVCAEPVGERRKEAGAGHAGGRRHEITAGHVGHCASSRISGGKAAGCRRCPSPTGLRLRDEVDGVVSLDPGARLDALPFAASARTRPAVTSAAAGSSSPSRRTPAPASGRPEPRLFEAAAPWPPPRCGRASPSNRARLAPWRSGA